MSGRTADGSCERAMGWALNSAAVNTGRYFLERARAYGGGALPRTLPPPRENGISGVVVTSITIRVARGMQQRRR